MLVLWKGGDDSEGTPAVTGWERRIVLSLIPFMVAFKINMKLVFQNPLLLLCIALQAYYFTAMGSEKKPKDK